MMEMLIAVVVTGIILMSLVLLLGYSTRNASMTQAKVALQDQAKDAVNHMAAYIMEGNHATWKDDQKLLVVEKDVEEPPLPGTTDKRLVKKEWYYYYRIGTKIYFKNVTDGDTSLVENDKHLLTDDVQDFSVKPDEKDPQTIHIDLELKDSYTDSVYHCKQDVHIRNECKGGGSHDS